MDVFSFFKLVLLIGIVLLSFASVYFVIEAIRVLCRVRKMMDRFMFITDVREWMQFASLFKKSSKLKK